jgi:hypothetical protein
MVDIFWDVSEKDWQGVDETIASIKTVQTIDADTRVRLIVCTSRTLHYSSFLPKRILLTQLDKHMPMAGFSKTNIVH